MEGKERNVFLLESGIDPFQPLFEMYVHAGEEVRSNFSFFEEYYGKGELFPSRPVCKFEGTKIPTMIRHSDKGSISPEILIKILQTIDELHIFKVYR